MPIDAKLILQQAQQIQELELDPARAAELAYEMRSLIDDVHAAAQTALFDDEPARFVSLLYQLRDR